MIKLIEYNLGVSFYKLEEKATAFDENMVKNSYHSGIFIGEVDERVVTLIGTHFKS